MKYNIGAVTGYICGKFYYVKYLNDSVFDGGIKGLLLNYASGNIVLLADEGVYHIKYNDILFMKPIKKFPLDKCSEEFRKLVQSFSSEEDEKV